MFDRNAIMCRRIGRVLNRAGMRPTRLASSLIHSVPIRLVNFCMSPKGLVLRKRGDLSKRCDVWALVRHECAVLA